MSANPRQTNAKEHKSSTGGNADAMGIVTIAYVDESIRMAANPPAYLMAATIPMRDGQLAPFEALFQRGARKLHWRDMPLPLRKKSVRAIAEMDHLTTVVLAAPLDRQKQERPLWDIRRTHVECRLDIGARLDRGHRDTRLKSAGAGSHDLTGNPASTSSPPSGRWRLCSVYPICALVITTVSIGEPSGSG